MCWALLTSYSVYPHVLQPEEKSLSAKILGFLLKNPVCRKTQASRNCKERKKHLCVKTTGTLPPASECLGTSHCSLKIKTENSNNPYLFSKGNSRPGQRCRTTLMISGDSVRSRQVVKGNAADCRTMAHKEKPSLAHGGNPQAVSHEATHNKTCFAYSPGLQMKPVLMPLPTAACPQSVPQKGGKRCPSPREAEQVLTGAQQVAGVSAEPHAANTGLCRDSA